MAQPSEPPEVSRPKRPRAKTQEARERELSSLAFDLAEKQLKDGTATAPVISYLLKIKSNREKLEQSKLEAEVTLLRARVKAIDQQEEIKELYTEALSAMREYSGQEVYHDPDDDL